MVSMYYIHDIGIFIHGEEDSIPFLLKTLKGYSKAYRMRKTNNE